MKRLLVNSERRDRQCGGVPVMFDLLTMPETGGLAILEAVGCSGSFFLILGSGESGDSDIVLGMKTQVDAVD